MSWDREYVIVSCAIVLDLAKGDFYREAGDIHH
jgi:hypothetical protein